MVDWPLGPQRVNMPYAWMLYLATAVGFTWSVLALVRWWPLAIAAAVVAGLAVAPEPYTGGPEPFARGLNDDLSVIADSSWARNIVLSYHFMSHPQSLDFGPEGFYEKHLAHISRRPDVWYVPMGPVYAFKTIVDATEVRQVGDGGRRPRFSVSNSLDRKIYSGSLTLEFAVPAPLSVFSNGKKLEAPRRTLTDRWNEEYVRREGDRVFVTVRPNTTLEFR